MTIRICDLRAGGAAWVSEVELAALIEAVEALARVVELREKQEQWLPVARATLRRFSFEEPSA